MLNHSRILFALSVHCMVNRVSDSFIPVGRVSSCPYPVSIGDDASGSGSGCADETCSRDPRLVPPITDRPVAIPYPAENERVKASAMQNLPSISIYLLTLLILLLRR